MKKEYEKPIAELVVFEFSEAIANCAVDITEGFADKNCLKSDYWYVDFDSENSCTKTDKYCYYTPDGNGIFQS